MIRGGCELHGRAARRRANPLLIGRAGVLHERPLPDVHGNAPVGKINKKSDLFRLMDFSGKEVAFFDWGKIKKHGSRRFPKGERRRSSVFLPIGHLWELLCNTKATPHNLAARRAMSFPPSVACRFFDLHPVNLQNLHLHLTKNPFASRPPHLCGVTLILI